MGSDAMILVFWMLTFKPTFSLSSFTYDFFFKLQMYSVTLDHESKVFLPYCTVSTLCNSMDHRPPGSSIHGILQARILEGVATFFSRGSSQPRGLTHVSHVTAEPLGKLQCHQPTLKGYSVFKPHVEWSKAFFCHQNRIFTSECNLE